MKITKQTKTEAKNLIAKYKPYLEELRRKVLIGLAFFIVIFVIGFLAYKPILELFFQLYHLKGVNITITSPFQTFNLAANIGLFGAIIISLPFFIYQILHFSRPALKSNERKMISPLILTSLILFSMGFSLGLSLMRLVSRQMSSTLLPQGAQNYWDAGKFLSQILLTSTFLGVIFEFPIIIFSLVKLKIVSVKSLEKKRRLVILGTFMFVALLPPTDAFSLIIMAGFVILLFEITLILLRKTEKGGESLCLAD